MIPRCYPTNENGSMIVFEIVSTGLRRWVDWIPVEDITTGAENRYDEDGYIPVEVLISNAGLQEWVDYIPVDFVTGDNWRSDDDGVIPVVLEV